jgi:Rieske Fe-S protein
MSEHNRRQFLKTLVTSAGAVAAASALDVGFFRLAKSSPAPVTVAVPVAEHDEFNAVGGAVVVAVPEVESVGGKIIVVRSAENTYNAIAAKCTHKGCIIGYDADNKRFECPCHGSQYGLDGSVLHGPTVKPLQAYSVSIANGIVSISIGGGAVMPADSTHK